MARPAKRSAGRGMEFSGAIRARNEVAQTDERRLLSISVLAKAAADCVAKIDELGSDGDEALLIRHSVQRDRHLHEIHCLAVELGLSGRQPWRYGTRSVQLTTGGAVPEIWRTPAERQGMPL